MELKQLPKTNHQLTVELRNKIAGQIIAQKASERYWRIVADEAKRDSQERLDALQKAAANQQLTSKDKKYLKVIDEMLEVQNG